MPSVTALSVFNEARGTYLNDVAGAVYTDTVMLPHLKSAYEHLRNELALNDIPTLDEVSSEQTVTALATSMSSFPTDVIVPIMMQERSVGSTEIWQLMEERTWVPNEAQASTLRFWMWRKEAIEFLGATTDRAVRLFYLRDLNPSAIASNATLQAANARSYLAARVAALVAMFIQNNSDLAQAANMVADDQLRKVIMINVKARQGLPTRRKPFIGSRRRSFQ